MGIVVIGAIFIDIKGYPLQSYIPSGRNAGTVIQVHGGVSRNVAEDIANLELRPTFVSLVDDTGLGTDVLEQLNKHKVNTKYIKRIKDGMGTWLAIFNNDGDVVASISKRPNLLPICDILDEKGDEIFENADSIVIEIDIDKEIVKRIFYYAKKYNKKIYCVVSNMSIAIERRDFIKEADCLVCNEQEAGMLFVENFENYTPEKLAETLHQKVISAGLNSMVITMGELGSVYASKDGEYGVVRAIDVHVKDTTGAGDSFFAGVTAGLTYGKTLKEACEIGTKLASSVICTTKNVCPRFLPSEFGLNFEE